MYYVMYKVNITYVVARLISWCDVLISSRNYLLIFTKLRIRRLNTGSFSNPYMRITVTCIKEEAVLNLPEQFLRNLQLVRIYLEITLLALRTPVPGQRPHM